MSEERVVRLDALLDEWRELTDVEIEELMLEHDDDLEMSKALASLPDSRQRADSLFTARVMSCIEARRPTLWRRVRDALLRPRTIQFRLATAAPVAVAMAVLAGGIATWSASRPSSSQHAAIAPPSSTIPATFQLAAPGAKSVVVVGDFNGWQAEETSSAMRDDDGDGVWTVTLPLAPGRYAYMFVVDGEQWVLDPQAEVVQPDGFGGENAILRM